MKYDVELLIAARLRKGWKQNKLAYLVDLSEAQVCRIEKGLFQNPETIEKMARILGVSMKKLVIPNGTHRGPGRPRRTEKV